METGTTTKNIFNGVLFIFLTVIAISCSSKKNDEAPLNISSFFPKSATIGDTVTISGTGFGADISAIKIKFGASRAVKPISVDNAKITVFVPVDATPGKISIDKTGGSNTISGIAFDVLPDLNDYANFDQIKGTASGSILLKPRDILAAAGAGYFILFGGGVINGAYSDFVDIYNTTTGQVEAAKLSEARSNLSAAGAGNKVIFAGGQTALNTYSDKVDIYDVVTHTWTQSKLSKARSLMAAVGYGNLIMFAGGISNNGSESIVDIYNTDTNTWTTAQLSLARNSFAGAATDGKILFAGGFGPIADAATTVDIYDVKTAKWTTSKMPNAHRGYDLWGAGAGNKIAFGGGGDLPNSALDLYNTSDGIWSKVDLSYPLYGSGTAAGTKIAFSVQGPFIKVYDVKTGMVITLPASQANFHLAAAAKNKIIFTNAGGGLPINYGNVFTVSK